MSQTPTTRVPAPSSDDQGDLLRKAYSSIGTWPQTDHPPLIYDSRYNISFAGFETWNKLDAWKLYKIFQLLVEKGLVMDGNQGAPLVEVSTEILQMVHSTEYLQELESSKITMIRMTELPALLLVPNFFVRRLILRPLRLQATGTILALGLALMRGWAIHIGGGMIHASRSRGAGWCPYDDITLAVRYAREHTDVVRRAMVIDFGAVQGNGFELNKLHFQDEDMIIVDVYNQVIFQHNDKARRAINVERRLPCGTSSDVYFSAIQSALDEASAYSVDVIVYAAGTNVLATDYSGQFRVTEEDVMKRDRLVFEFAREKDTPICMVTSSGYATDNYRVVADCIAAIIDDRTASTTSNT